MEKLSEFTHFQEESTTDIHKNMNSGTHGTQRDALFLELRPTKNPHYTWVFRLSGTQGRKNTVKPEIFFSCIQLKKNKS